MGNTGEAATAAIQQERVTKPLESDAIQSQPGETQFEPKPDVSEKSAEELLPELLNHFHNNKEELARALGLHRSTINRLLNGTSRPNNSTLLRMRGIAQERGIE